MPGSPAATLDISAERCPMTWVRTKLALEALSPGELLEVVLGPGEMLENVPRNAQEDGHELLSRESFGVDRHRILLRKRGP